MYDDMIRTGGSLLQAAKAYKEAGAAEIYVLATHGVLPEGALNKLKISGLIEKIVVTNTHPNAPAQQDNFLEVVSVGDLIAEKLLSIRSI